MRFGTTLTAIVVFAISSVTADSIYQIAKSNDVFTTLVFIIDAAGLDGVLSDAGTYTVFAPPNTAFGKLDQTARTTLLQPEWKLHLQDLLKYHVLDSKVLSTDLTDGLTTNALNGQSMIINLDPPRINDVSNIDLALADIDADNGVIHAIDNVLLPTSLTSNIFDIAQANPNFSTLVELIIAADLVGAATGEGSLTVFAPTNDAFDKLPVGTVNDLKKAENKQKLADIINYHMVGANVASGDLVTGPAVTLQTSTVQIDAMAKTVNDAKIVTTDILASNGIIQVIDTVLIPAADTAPTKAPASGGGLSQVLSAAAFAVGEVTYLLF